MHVNTLRIRLKYSEKMKELRSLKIANRDYLRTDLWVEIELHIVE